MQEPRIEANIYRTHGKWRIELTLPRWMVDDMNDLSYSGATLRISGSSIMGGSGPHSTAHLYIAQEPPVPKEPLP